MEVLTRFTVDGKQVVVSCFRVLYIFFVDLEGEKAINA